MSRREIAARTHHMPPLPSRLRMLIAGCVAIVALTAFIVFPFRNEGMPVYARDGHVDLLSARQFWSDEIQRSGAATAQHDFLKVARTLPIAPGHTLAHSFGEALYQKLGSDGIAYCDDAFVYGCYHQLIGSAIASAGMTVIPKLYLACTASGAGAFGCAHGIGHGIVGYLGYTSADLRQALDVCRSGTDHAMERGCWDGAFMEYNIHELASLADNGTSIPRELTESNTYSPCDQLPHTYATACAYELPVWWIAAMSAPLSDEDRVRRAGSLCAAYPSRSDVEEFCFRGLGSAIESMVNFDSAMARASCEDVASSTTTQLFCLSGAANRYSVAGRGSREEACASLGLTGSAFEYCATSVTH